VPCGRTLIPKRAHIALLFVNLEMLLQKMPIFMISNFVIRTVLLLKELGVSAIEMSVYISRIVEVELEPRRTIEKLETLA
jgi:hypothetical protein